MSKFRDRKRQQRKMNKAIKQVNKNIIKDSFWRGRFVARQVDAFYYPYEDGSGGALTAKIELRDKKNWFYISYLY